MGYYSTMTDHEFNMKPNLSCDYIDWCRDNRYDPHDPFLDDCFKAYTGRYEEWQEMVAKHAQDGSWYILRGEEGEQDKATLINGEWITTDSRVVWEDDPVHDELRILRDIHDVLENVGDLKEQLGKPGAYLEKLLQDMKELKGEV